MDSKYENKENEFNCWYLISEVNRIRIRRDKIVNTKTI